MGTSLSLGVHLWVGHWTGLPCKWLSYSLHIKKGTRSKIASGALLNRLEGFVTEA